jgi:hypothetical protein
MADTDLSAEVLRLQFSYDPDTGDFIRRGESKASGRISTKGYRQIFVQGRRYAAHRLAWLYVHGVWPDGQLDHKNQIKDDNRIENLRPADNQTNQENVEKWTHNRSGRRGVALHGDGTYRADIKVDGRTIYLGRFHNIVDAVAARMRAERKHFVMLEHSPNYSGITHDLDSPSVRHARSALAPGTKLVR